MIGPGCSAGHGKDYDGLAIEQVSAGGFDPFAILSGLICGCRRMLRFMVVLVKGEKTGQSLRPVRVPCDAVH